MKLLQELDQSTPYMYMSRRSRVILKSGLLIVVMFFLLLQLFTVFPPLGVPEIVAATTIQNGVSLHEASDRTAMDNFEVLQGRKLDIVNLFLSWQYFLHFTHQVGVNKAGAAITLETEMNDVYANGSIPELTWSPGSAAGGYSLQEIIDGGSTRMLDASGVMTTTTLDQYIRDMGVSIRAWQASHGNSEVRIRLMPELNLYNGSWTTNHLGNNATLYKNAFRHIVDVFENDGIPGVNTSKKIKWVYNVNFITYPNSIAANTYTDPYPGSNYVDINSIDAYPNNQYKTFTSIIDPAYKAFAALNNKPIEISEWACIEGPDKAAWITDAFARLRSGQYPLINSIVWFHSTIPYNYSLYTASGSAAAYKAGLDSLMPPSTNPTPKPTSPAPTTKPTPNAVAPTTNKPITINGATITFTSLPSGVTSLNISVDHSATTSQSAPADKNILSSYFITATDMSGKEITNGFNALITLSYSGLKSGDKVVYWNGSSWSMDGISNQQVNVPSSISFSTTHFTRFGILRDTGGVTSGHNSNGKWMYIISAIVVLILDILFMVYMFAKSRKIITR